MGYSLGVDLGTTFVAAAVAHPNRIDTFTLGDRTVVTPSVVYRREDDVIITGEAANRRAVSSPDRAVREFKRRIGDPTPVMLGGTPHTVTELLAAVLRDVLTRITQTEGDQPERVVLTHPANWGPFRRGLFEEVPTMTDLEDVLLTTEPEAAAAHYAASHDLDDGEIVAVYDLGGGTFDATVLRSRDDGVEIVGTPEGIERLGGLDFDEAILNFVNYTSGGALSELDMRDPQTAIAVARLRQDCALAKEALSIDDDTTLPVFLPGRHFDVPITRTKFESLVRAQIESTIGALSRTLSSAGIAPSELSAVLLVGGSSRIPLVAEMVSAELGRPIVVDAHPKYAVALGAATLARVAAQSPHAAAVAGLGQITGEPRDSHYGGTSRKAGLADGAVAGSGSSPAAPSRKLDVAKSVSSPNVGGSRAGSTAADKPLDEPAWSSCDASTSTVVSGGQTGRNLDIVPDSRSAPPPRSGSASPTPVTGSTSGWARPWTSGAQDGAVPAEPAVSPGPQAWSPAPPAQRVPPTRQVPPGQRRRAGRYR